MLVHIDRYESYDYFLKMIDQDSSDYERKFAVEISDSLLSRYKSAMDEYGEVQELLKHLDPR